MTFPVKLDWLTVLSQNVSSMWVWYAIFHQTGLADIALSKCPQAVSVAWDFLPLNWLTVQFQNVSREWVWPGIFWQTGLADSALSKCVQGVSVTQHFLWNWIGWQCSLKMCPGSECFLAFPTKLNWLIVLSQNVSSLWVWCGICQTGLADSGLSKYVQKVSVTWHFQPNWSLLTVLFQNVSRKWVWCGISCQTGLFWQCPFKMCPACKCDVAFPAKLDWLTVSFQNVSREWVWCDISCQTGLCWQCSLKMCPESECDLAFSAKLDWLTVLSQNVSRLWVWPGICQTGLCWWCSLIMCPGSKCVLPFSVKVDWLTVLSSKCVQHVSVKWYCLPNWTGWQCSLKMCPVCEYDLALPAKWDFSDTALSKCVQYVSVIWHFLPNWTFLIVPSQNVSRKWVWSGISSKIGLCWQCSLKMCSVCECDVLFPAKLLTVLS